MQQRFHRALSDKMHHYTETALEEVYSQIEVALTVAFNFNAYLRTNPGSSRDAQYARLERSSHPRSLSRPAPSR